MPASTLESKSLEELRAQARALGLRGYSKLRKQELIELLRAKPAGDLAKSPGEHKRARAVSVAKPGKPRAAKKAPVAAPRTPVAGAPAQRPPEPPASLETRPAQPSSEEERIEISKFAVSPAGTSLSPRALTDTLHENIEQLPALPTSVLCLLPQKPGVLYAYWVLAASPPAPLAHLKLRLCRRRSEGTIEILEEVALPAATAGWYFHVPDDAVPGEFLVHLGHYRADGEFVTAIERGIARIPSLYASAQTDRRWWISDAEFRALYRRAGGIVRGTRLGWPGGVSSQR
jgi:hypothetical protein